MSLQSVKTDYEKELAVLQAWKTRMGLSFVTNEVPPEFLMSDEYKCGWRTYLDAVMAIGVRMIAECENAAAAGNNNALKALLTKEAEAYNKLALEAQSLELPELETMLRHEAKSRGEIADAL